MKQQDFSKRIYLGITGEKNIDWQKKLKEINELKIKEAAVFLSRFDKNERDNFYRFLLKSSIKKVPLVHLRDDIEKKEMKFFIEKYKTRHFNIHEDHFKILDKWLGFWKKLYLEMDYDSQIAKNVKVRKIGGFCIDLSHFKTAVARGEEEAYYVFLRRNKIKFTCNHLNGYDPGKREEKHTITSLKDFDYLTTLPKYVFGEIIALEVENSIKEQIKLKEYLSGLLNDYFYGRKN
ncbi:MAG: hypothetical protein ABIG08_01130 [bacterium]